MISVCINNRLKLTKYGLQPGISASMFIDFDYLCRRFEEEFGIDLKHHDINYGEYERHYACSFTEAPVLTHENLKQLPYHTKYLPLTIYSESATQFNLVYVYLNSYIEHEIKG